MVMSATYRQSSEANSKSLKADPDNRYFSRMNRRRLDFEATRDTIVVPVTPEEPREPVNVLLLGSDSRAGLTREERESLSISPAEGRRSDTIILVHFDPRRGKAVLVHFPRDLRVDIPGRGPGRINEAFRVGGPRLMIRTVRRFSGLPIHHYVEIDFNGFRRLVDSLGGLRMCVDRPMHDQRAGLQIPRAGCYRFDGNRALAFVRARNVEGDLIPDTSENATGEQDQREEGGVGQLHGVS